MSRKLSFKDEKGRQWVLRIDGNVICEYEDLTGIDLFAVFAERGISGPVPAFHNFMDLLYLAGNAEEKGLDKKDFRGAIYGTTLEQAWSALNEALYNFFPALRTLADGMTEKFQIPGMNVGLGADKTSSNSEQPQESATPESTPSKS